MLSPSMPSFPFPAGSPGLTQRECRDLSPRGARTQKEIPALRPACKPGIRPGQLGDLLLA